MSRTERLFVLIQYLRRQRLPTSGKRLSEELNISLRTLYRDIAMLQAFGAPIEGEAGVGYVLRPGFVLPPLMFSIDEVEAIVLGSRWVSQRGDTQLQLAAQNVLAKIAAVIPTELKNELETSGLLVPPSQSAISRDDDLILIRKAIRSEQKLNLEYQDLQGKFSKRTIWPIALGFFDEVPLIVAWCELKEDFRHFRADRIIKLDATNVRYPERRQILLKKWRTIHNIPQPKY